MIESRDEQTSTKVDPQAPIDETRTSVDVPDWFAGLLIVVLATVLGWSGPGLALAVVGRLSLGAVAPFGLLGSVLGAVVAWRFVRVPRTEQPLVDVTDAADAADDAANANTPAMAGAERRTRNRATLALCALLGVITVWNAANAGHHVRINRDPGGYSTIAKWIANHGDLLVHVPATWPAFTHSASAAVYDEPGRTLEFQWSHLYSVVLAEADLLGGDALLFRVNAILSALSLCFVFAVGCRLSRRPWIALAATVGLAVSLPQIYTVRDTYSEPTTQFFLWSGIWLTLVTFDRRRTGLPLGTAVLAGGAFGGAVMTRIDAIAYVMLLPLIAALCLLVAAPENRKRLLASCAAMAAGATPFVAVGLIDVQRHSGQYYTDLHSEIMRLYLISGLSVVGGILLCGLLPLRSALATRLTPHRVHVAPLAGWAVAVGLLLAWALRPALLIERIPASKSGSAGARLVAAVQATEGLPIDPTRTYAEQSLVWFQWYLGPITLLLAIAGAGILVARMIRRHSVDALVVLVIAGAITAIYLWMPNIASDHPWASRRYVPASFPQFALLAMVGLAELTGRLTRGSNNFRTGALAMGMIGFVAFPLATTWPVRDYSPDAGMSVAVKRVCNATGPKSALLILPARPGETFGAGTHMQTLRSFCDVPVASVDNTITTQQVADVAKAWAAQGRTLWVLASAQETIAKLQSPAAATLIVRAEGTRDIKLSLTRAPSRYASVGLTVWGARVG